MKVVLIEQNPIMNKGFSLFLRNIKSIESVKSFTEFEHFLLSYSNITKQIYNVYILNISYLKPEQGIDYLRILDSMVEGEIIIVIYEKHKPYFSNSSLIKNRIVFFQIENSLEKFGAIIQSFRA